MRALVVLLIALAGIAGGALGGVYAGLRLGDWPASWPAFESARFALGWLVHALSPRAGELIAGANAGAFVEAIQQYGVVFPVRAAAAGALAGACVGLVIAAVVCAGVSRLRPRSRAAGGEMEASGDVMQIGEVRIPRRFENFHTLALGSSGVGKTQTLRAAALVARRRGDPALVLDWGSELLTRLYRKDTDVIIAAYDARSVPWSPLAEMHSEDDAERLSNLMVPDTGGAESREWAGYARTIIEGVLVALWRLKERGEIVNNRVFARALANGDRAALRELIGEEHPAFSLLKDGQGAMAENAISIASSKAKVLRCLDPAAGFGGWSVVHHIEQIADRRGGAGWLYVPVPTKYKDAALPLASMVASVAIDAVLGLEESDRRVWFIVDELGQYPAISALARAQTLGRKYGLACVHAVQTISQLRESYGEQGAITLLGNYANRAIYRCQDADTAEWASRDIGDTQVLREVRSHGTSTSAGQAGGGSSSNTAEQYSIERAVLGSEIQALRERAIYLRTPALGSVRKTLAEYVDLGPQRMPAFVPRERPAAAKSGSGTQSQPPRGDGATAQAPALPPAQKIGARSADAERKNARLAEVRRRAGARLKSADAERESGAPADRPPAQ